MMKIGARIYFDTATGEVILNTGERAGDVVELTPAQERERYIALSELVESSYGYIDLAYGQYKQDFAACIGYRVNVVTNEMEFIYPNEEPTPEPVYQSPLTEQVTTQQSQIDALTLEILTLKGLV